jgi:hypothetical protein
VLEHLISFALRPIGDYLVLGLGRKIIRAVTLGWVDCEDSTAIAYRRWGGVTVGWLPTAFAGAIGWIAIIWVVAVVLDRHA